MLRMLSSLGLVCLTLATAALSDEAPRRFASQSVEESGGIPGPAHSHTATGRIIRVAQKTGSKPGAEKNKDSAPTDAKPATTPAASEKTATPAPDKDGLKFSRDIAPILVGNCLGCHNERAMAKNGKLDLSTFEKLRKGGAGGPSFVAGMPEESHLYLRLTGDETPRMPRGAQNQLSEAAIEKVGEWIKAGAIFDAGLDPKAPLASYSATPEQLRRAEMAKLSVTERDKLVEKTGTDRWKKGNLKENPEVTTGKSVMLFARIPKERAHATIKVVEAQYSQILGLIEPNESQEPVEKIGLYVFNERSHFVEFVRNIENRDVDRQEQATVDLVGPAPYVAVLDPLEGRTEPPAAPKRPSRSKKKSRDESSDVSRSLGGLITDQLAEGTVLRVNPKAPVWLTLGLGEFFGSRIDPRSPHTQRLRREAFEQFRNNWNSRATDALGGEGNPNAVRAIGFGIIEALGSVRETRQLLPDFVASLLAEKAKLDDVLKDVLGTDREQFLAATGEFVATQYGRIR